MNYKYDIKDVKRHANGNWHGILTRNGIDSRYLTGKNCSCPICGGKDRFRWDNKNGDGGGFCHQCDLRGDGLSFLAKWLGLEGRANLPKLLEKVGDELAMIPYQSAEEKAVQTFKKEQKDNRQLAQEIWEDSRPLHNNADCPIIQYLSWRGLKAPQTDALRVSIVEYFQRGELIEQFPGMIGKVVDIYGNFLGVHKTFMGPWYYGNSLNPPRIDYWKQMLGPIGGGSIHLDPASDVLHVAEGIETTLAVREAVEGNFWCALSATNLPKIDLPSMVKEVHIWADLDKSGAGERAAHDLARRLYHEGVNAYIHLPQGPIPEGQKSLDWLDIHNSGLADQIRRAFHGKR